MKGVDDERCRRSTDDDVDVGQGGQVDDVGTMRSSRQDDGDDDDGQTKDDGVRASMSEVVGKSKRKKQA